MRVESGASQINAMVFDHVQCWFSSFFSFDLFPTSKPGDVLSLLHSVPSHPKPCEFTSMRVRLGANVCHCLIDAVDGIRLLVWDLNAKFLLNCHDDFNGVQTVQTKVIPKVRGCIDLELSVHMSIHDTRCGMADLCHVRNLRKS
jgi:hypothetical protein